MEQNRNNIRRVMAAVNTIDGIYALEAKQIKLKENTLSLLYALDDGNPHSQKQICEEWLIPKTTINTVVKECASAGYVTLKSEQHSREKLICLTESGRDYARKVLSQVYAVEDEAMKKTLTDYSTGFVKAIEQFSIHLRKEYHKHFMEADNYE